MTERLTEGWEADLRARCADHWDWRAENPGPATWIDVRALLGEVEALRAENAAHVETIMVALARAEAAEAERDHWKSAALGVARAALAEPVEPQPSACATCGDQRIVHTDHYEGTDHGGFVPCPSCTPPDPAP